MYLKPIRLAVIATIAIALIFAAATTTVNRTKPALAQPDSSITATTITPSLSTEQGFSAITTGHDEVPPANIDRTGAIKLTSNTQQDVLDYVSYYKFKWSCYWSSY